MHPKSRYAKLFPLSYKAKKGYLIIQMNMKVTQSNDSSKFIIWIRDGLKKWTELHREKTSLIEEVVTKSEVIDNFRRYGKVTGKKSKFVAV